MQKETINFIDNNHAWTPSLFGCNRSYNLIRLLLDCNQPAAVEQLLNATDRPLGLNMRPIINQSFLALNRRYTKDPTTTQTDKDTIKN